METESSVYLGSREGDLKGREVGTWGLVDFEAKALTPSYLSQISSFV